MAKNTSTLGDITPKKNVFLAYGRLFQMNIYVYVYIYRYIHIYNNKIKIGNGIYGRRTRKEKPISNINDGYIDFSI